MAAPPVSVILPVRNGGRYLEAAVSSILGQTLDDIELILIDDHSDDGAAAALGGADRRLRLVSSGGRGVIAAFSTGQGRPCRDPGVHAVAWTPGGQGLPVRGLTRTARLLIYNTPVSDVAGWKR
ncbi:MAG: glycosyltransferase [Xanthomonadales bacterium]|nr:glycosyltransferase [Xanthomonadales bacterium]NIX13440.1 glycosyltransferase [Xanthomonadales bacterium]